MNDQIPSRNGSGGRYPYNMPGAAPAPGPLPAEKSPTSRLFVFSLFAGAALTGHLLMRWCFLRLLGREDLLGLYRSSVEMSCLFEMAYTLFCVGLPFLLVYLLLKRRKDIFAPAPLGGVYSGYNAFLLIFAGLGVCLAGSLLTNLFAAWADSIGYGFYSYYDALEGEEIPGSAAGMALMVLRSAVAPALVEEFCFRGVLLQPLRKYGDWYAILVTALFFGLMHGNMTQMPFAIVAGVALGYCAVVSGSLWIGILIHFLNNFVSVCFSFVGEYYGEKASMLFSNVAVYGFMGIGLLALIFYALRNPAFLRLRAGEYRGAKKYAFFLSPTLLVAFFAMLWITVQDIQFS